MTPSDSAAQKLEVLPFTGELARIYEPISDELQALNRFLAEEFAGGDSFIDELLTHVARYRGKQIRPACLLLMGNWFGKATHEHVLCGSVIELVHTATLVHDDILDDAKIRRRVETLNQRWGERAAILLGDFIYSRAFELSTRVEGVSEILARATHTVCEGELLQVGSAFDLELDEQRYSEIICKKTGVLYAVSCQLGAMLSGATEEEQALCAEFGKNLGMAFQIADDALDLVGDPQKVGKSLGTDLKKGKLTLPLIRLRDTLSGGKLEEYTWLLSHPNEVGTHQRVLQMLKDYDIGDDVQATATGYIEGAVAILSELPDSPMRDSLIELSRYLSSREL